LVTNANAMNATLYEKLNFNFIRDIAPVASIMRAPFVMVVNPSHPAKTVPEFIAYARANPGRISMASLDIGTGTHMSGELFKMMAGVNMVQVPYRGDAPAVTDLISGQVQVMFCNTVSSVEHIRAGRLRALAVTTATRSDALPDVPTVGEFLQGYEASAWWGFGAPKNASAEIVEKLNKEINAGLADPKIKARLAELGGTVLPSSPAEFGKLIADETEKWDQPEKVYVHHRLWERRRDVISWLDGGAFLYVCGDAKSMAKDVRAALVHAYADVKAVTPEAAERAVAELERNKRYMQDVY
jgi:tripartite-type tricarboxylate transporter receptor subunit TctC